MDEDIMVGRSLSESAALPVPQQARTTLPERASSPEVTPHA